MDLESFFISSLKKSGVTQDLDDDCVSLAFLKNKKSTYITAMDSFVEDIHFRLDSTESNLQKHIITTFAGGDSKSINHNSKNWLSYKNLSKKAFLVNISDILSSGGLAKYALLAITLPRHITKTQILQIIEGIKEICEKYNIKIIGGDTTKGDRLGFHITLFGEIERKYLHRKNVKNGDFIAYTSARGGNLGSSFKALKSLLRYGARVNSLPQNILEIKSGYAKFCAPQLREKFLFKASDKINACMDISDGLASEISRLQRLNGLHFLPFLPYLPFKNENLYKSGEEYELLFTFKPKNLVALKRLAALSRINLHIIGKFGRFHPTKLKTKPWH